MLFTFIYRMLPNAPLFAMLKCILVSVVEFLFLIYIIYIATAFSIIFSYIFYLFNTILF